MADHGRGMSGVLSGACLGHHLGYVWGIIWGMSGASTGACLAHHLDMSGASSGAFLGHVWGMSGASSGECLGHIVNNGQQWTTIYGATCICDAVFMYLVARQCYATNPYQANPSTRPKPDCF